MRKYIFEKIIKNLGELHFAGRISPYMNDEPLLEKRLPHMIDYIRYNCPRAYIMINSNGDILNEELLLALIISGLNCLTINCYDSIEQFESKVKFISQLSQKHCKFNVHVDGPQNEEYLAHPVDYHFVEIRDCSHYSIDSEFLTSRAGNVRNKIPQVRLPIKQYCPRPFNQMFINYRGEAIICCEDWDYQAIMGNANIACLEEIWYGFEYEHYRSFLRKNDRSLPVCCVCDFLEG
jgi:hypothetical protein